MIPKTRNEFKQYCLRKLGYPVIEINVSEDQVDDRVDEALRYWMDFHFDGSERIYYKHQVAKKDRQGSLSEIVVLKGGTGYSSGDTVIISANENDGNGAEATLNVDSNGTILSVTVTNPGEHYRLVPTITIDTTTGSGASFQAYNGGYITLPENIIGAVNIFSIGDPAIRSGDLFNINYQIALNDLYTLTSVSMIPYYMAMTHISLIQEMLVGKQLMRYNRHMNRLYLDMNWEKVNDGDYLLVEAYQVVDPEVYTDAWNDRWLQNYATLLIQKQWGQNLIKFSGMQLPGGVQFNGAQILNDAVQEIDKMETEMVNTYSLPSVNMIG
jgi:hypothetical protein